MSSAAFYTVTLTIWGGCNPLNPPPPKSAPEIGYALGKVRDNAILHHRASTKKGYVTNTMRIGAGALAER